jgi:membrane-bound lytic murein transglycosylase A
MKQRRRTVLSTIILAAAMLPAAGCKKPLAAPEYDRPLPPGASGLRLVPPEQWPSLALAHAAPGADLAEAIGRGLDWFDIASTRAFFPTAGVSHEAAALSLYAAGTILAETGTSQDFETRMRRNFDLYTSVGWDGTGTVLFTGYYSPEFEGSRTMSGPFRYPLYDRPDDLDIDPNTGRVLGRRMGAVHVRYPARAGIDADPGSLGLVGREVVYLRSPLEAYLIHVNGSAKLTMQDGSTMFVGYAGTNGREYTSIGRLLVKDGRIPRGGLSLPALRDYFARHPDDLETYTRRNERYVFFREYDGGRWPSGSLGFKVTAWRTLATDKKIFPRGCLVLVNTQVPDYATGAARSYSHFMLDQDTGGAIRAPGRADIYMGIGQGAEKLAGRQAVEGRLYYFVLKPAALDEWRRRARQAPMTVTMKH